MKKIHGGGRLHQTLTFSFFRNEITNEKEEKGKERNVKENLNNEFREADRVTGKLPDGISKEIVSFANTEGGEIYIGIRNDGTVVGVSNPDDVMTRISNTAHDTINPDIIPFLQIRTVQKYLPNLKKTAFLKKYYHFLIKSLKNI